MLKNTAASYGSITKFLHWLIAVLILFMLALGFYMVNWGSPVLFDIHKLMGLVVLILAAIRILWALCNPRPKLNIHKLEKVISHAVRGLLYVCMLLIPLSGWAMSSAFGYFPHLGSLAFPMPGIPIDPTLGSLFLTIHLTAAIVLMVLIVLHVAGALKHHFIDRDNILKRMLP